MCLFDPDTLSALLRPRQSEELRDRFAHTPGAARHTSAINVAELRYGAERRPEADRRARLTIGITQLLAQVTIPSFDEAAAQIFARVRVELERQGRPRAIPDLMIAAVALSRDLIVVTGNLVHFEPIPGLRVQNWIPRF